MIVLFLGKVWVLESGKEVVIFVFGILLYFCKLVVVELNVILVDMCFVKFFDEVLILVLVESYFLLVMVEENVVLGGVGLVVNELLV